MLCSAQAAAPAVSEQEAELAAACLRAVAENSVALASIKAAAAASRQQGDGVQPPRLPIEQLVTAFVKAIFETQVRGRFTAATQQAALKLQVLKPFHIPAAACWHSTDRASTQTD